MSKYRRAARVDDNQSSIVSVLRSLPGITVQVGHDDILVGHKGKNYWYEVKNPNTISKRTGEILDSKIKTSQKYIRQSWSGHYRLVWSVEQILDDLGIVRHNKPGES